MVRPGVWPFLLLLAALPAPARAQRPDGGSYAPAPAPGRCAALGPLGLRVLLDSAALGGGEVEIAELTLPPGWDDRGPGHRHGRVEVLVVLSGRLEHVVNDSAAVLAAGGVGVVRPGDRVRHHVLSADPVRALVIWAPGGELERILSGARSRPCP